MRRPSLIQSVIQQFKQDVQTRALVPDAQGVLPTQVELAKRYAVGLNTVKRAITELDRAGFIRSIRGKGLLLANGPGLASNGNGNHEPRVRIGVAVQNLFADISNPFIRQAIQGMESFCPGHTIDLQLFGYNLTSTPGSPEALTAHLSGLRFDGLILMSPADMAALVGIMELGIPFVSLNLLSDEQAVCLVNDSARATFQLVRCLLDRKLRQIILYGGNPNKISYQQRVNGYRMAFEAAGLPFAATNVLEGDYDWETTQTHLDAWIHAHGKPDAVVAYDAVMVAEVKRYLARKHLTHVVTGSFGRASDGRATADIEIDLHMDRIGHDAIQTLYGMIRGERPRVTKIYYDPDIVVHDGGRA